MGLIKSIQGVDAHLSDIFYALKPQPSTKSKNYLAESTIDAQGLLKVSRLEEIQAMLKAKIKDCDAKIEETMTLEKKIKSHVDETKRRVTR